MPMIDVKCPTCGNETEIFRHVSQIDDPMPQCHTGCEGPPVERIYVYQRPHSYSTGRILSVVYKNPDGTIGVLGHINGRLPEGAERIEIRSAADAQRVRKMMTAEQYQKFQQKQERDERIFGEQQRLQRSELRRLMEGMSPRGRDFARAAMRMNDNAPRKRFQTNVVFDAFENNASNRDGYRGDDHRQGRK